MDVSRTDITQLPSSGARTEMTSSTNISSPASARCLFLPMMPHAIKGRESFAMFAELHRAQLEASGVPERYWNTLFEKLKNEVFDAGNTFMIQRVILCEEEDPEDEMGAEGGGGTGEESMTEETWQVVVNQPDGVSGSDPDAIYLVDHAWTYYVGDARRHLEKVPGLLKRMATLMDLDYEEQEHQQVMEDVLREMWKFNQTYTIGTATEGVMEPLWYVMDEFGCRVSHSATPTVRMVPFCYVPTQTSFTLLWPLSDIPNGGEATRNFIEGEANSDHLVKTIMMLPWEPEDMTHLRYELKDVDDQFFSKYKIFGSLPNAAMDPPCLPCDRNVNVFTDMDLLSNNLTDPRFRIMDCMDEADIIWTGQMFSDFRSLSEDSPDCFINQFPFELVVTVRDLLALTVRRRATRYIDPTTLASWPRWMPTTFNIAAELPQFVSYFQHRQQRGLPNYWLCEASCSGRYKDTHLTSDLTHLLRLPDTGPKMACYYAEDPVLLEMEGKGAVRFDLHFAVMLQGANPLKVAVHNNFLVHTAAKSFSLDHFDDLDKHLPTHAHLQMLCEDFIHMFEQQYADYTWTTVQESVHEVIRELFEAATAQSPPKAIAHSPQSRALYNLRFSLKWDTTETGERCMQPVLYECQSGADAMRLARCYPTFINDVFSFLFFDDVESSEVVAL